jgi:chromosome segregation ATPase
MNNKNYSIVMTVLFLLALVGLLLMWNRGNRLQSANTTYVAEVDSLTQIKYELLNDLDSLQLAFEGLALQSDSLSEALAGAKETIAKLEQVRRQNSAGAESLRREINQLRALKADLESTVTQLREENEQLLAANEQLTVQLEASETRNLQLTSQTQELEEANKTLLDEMNRLRAASVKASGFQVDINRNSGRGTTSARRSRTLDISFDLTEVPREFHGLHTVYLVISDATGTPIKSLNPIRTRITANNQVAEIEAQAAKEVNLTASQRLNFKHEVQERLSAGYYRVAVYSDLGFLGSAAFRLT